MKLWTSVQVKNPKSRFMAVITCAPIMPGTWTRFSMKCGEPVDRERGDEIERR